MHGMWARRIEVRGLVGADAWSADDLGRVVDLPAAPRGTAIGDALGLLAATLRPDSLAERAPDLDLPPAIEVHAGGGPLEQVAWGGPVAPGWLGPDARIGVELGLELDPPAWTALREHALRDPRLAGALADGPTIEVKIGWLFTRDRSVAGAALHGFRVGRTPLPVSAAERGAWLAPLLADVGRRIGRVRWGEDGLGERLLTASLSPDPEVRRRFDELVAMFAEAPFGWGALALVRRGGAVGIAFGRELVPLRQHGPDAGGLVALAEAMWLDAPDVLVVDRALPPGVRAWLRARIDADGAPIEQVLLVGGAP